MIKIVLWWLSSSTCDHSGRSVGKTSEPGMSARATARWFSGGFLGESRNAEERWRDGRGTCLLECLNDTGFPRCWDLKHVLLPLLSAFSGLCLGGLCLSHQRDALILLPTISRPSSRRAGAGEASGAETSERAWKASRPREVTAHGRAPGPSPARAGPGRPRQRARSAARPSAGGGGGPGGSRSLSLSLAPRVAPRGSEGRRAAGSQRRSARPGGAGSGSGAGRRGEEAGSPSPAAGSSPRPPRLRPLRRAHGRACPRRRCRSGGAGGRPRSPGSPSPARPAGRRWRRRAAGAGKPRRPRRTRGRGAEPGGTALPRPRGRTGGSDRRNQVRGRERVRGASVAPRWFWGFFGVFRKEKRVLVGGRGAGPVSGAARLEPGRARWV